MGYQTDTLEQNKFVIKAIQFEDVTSGKVEVNKVFKGFDSVAVEWDKKGDFTLTAPQIQVQSATGYETYYYLTNALLVKDDNSEEEVVGWANVGGDYVDLALTPGTAIWVKTPNDATATTASGAVATEASAVTVSADKFTLIGNIFPTAVTLNGSQMTIEGLEGSDWDRNDEFMQTAPQIQVQSATGYNTYYYLNNALLVDGDKEKEVAGWANVGGDYVTDTIPAGKGFWLKAATKLNVSFNL